MVPATVFSLVNLAALAGWVVLALSPLLPRRLVALAGELLPLVLATLYTGLMLAFWSRAQGGFGSLEQVMALFDTPQIALAGWVHFLAFDLFVGGWIVRAAREAGMAFALVLPCLGLCFLFGPAGLLVFSVLRAVRGAASTRELPR